MCVLSLGVMGVRACTLRTHIGWERVSGAGRDTGGLQRCTPSLPAARSSEELLHWIGACLASTCVGYAGARAQQQPDGGKGCQAGQHLCAMGRRAYRAAQRNLRREVGRKALG